MSDRKILLDYVEAGKQSGPAIVFMAGFPDCQQSSWGSLLPEELGKTHRLIFLCFPGYEIPAKLERRWGYSFQELISIVHDTLEHLGLTAKPGSFYLVAHDWGAALAQMYLTQYPTAASKLVLCDIGNKNDFYSAKELLVIVLYQIIFALSYVLSQLIAVSLGEFIVAVYAVSGIAKHTGPCPHDRLWIPQKEFTVKKWLVPDDCR